MSGVRGEPAGAPARTTLRAREARAAEALLEAVAAPEPPLPPVAGTDAVASFATWLACAPQPNRALLRATLLGLAAIRFPHRDRAGRLALLRRLGHSPLAEGLRATAAVSYYGDAGVLRALGHGAPGHRHGAPPATAPGDGARPARASGDGGWPAPAPNDSARPATAGRRGTAA